MFIFALVSGFNTNLLHSHCSYKLQGFSSLKIQLRLYKTSYLALFMHSISSFMLCWFIVKLVWNSQILSVGKRKARKITRRGKNSHRYNLLRQLPFFWGGLFLGLWMSSHVKNFSYAHEFLRLFLWLQGLALALMETGLRTGRSRLHWDKTQRQRQDSLSSSYNGSCISQNAWFLCFK